VKTKHEIFSHRLFSPRNFKHSHEPPNSDGSSLTSDIKEKHLNREGVAFAIGQVVQHKTERWRGVVAGWQRLGLPTTSLTTKSYDDDDKEQKDVTKETSDDANVQYEILLDSGDASLLGGRRPGYDATAMPTARQTDLELVKDKDLLRIRSSWVQQHFECFDPVQRRFIPNETRRYQYPLDVKGLQGSDPDDAITLRRNELGKGLVSGIQEFTARLERCVSVESRGYSLLAKIHSRLEELAKGDVLSPKELLSSRELSPFDLAVLHLRTLLNVSMELGEMMWARQIADENRERIRFKLGDIVHHTKYGFRGVVVAWDPTPTVDVSRWDGLVGIENASELPFYHVIPDQNDCIEAFGGERPFRYVCEANLEPCPRNRTLLNVDLDPEWEMDHAGARYAPPDDLKVSWHTLLGVFGTSCCVF
jgi:hemimethylated DNA binding protein